jgi:hypothetical protein
MKYLAITSKGEIEPEALSLMGASTKRGDSSKIGMFGSGNKFAIAYLMRSDLTPIVFSGTREIKLDTEEVTFRDQPFTTITVDGHKTSLTTSMGKDWDCWMAVREIFANAIDEGDARITVIDVPCGITGQTNFYIPINDQVQEFADNMGDYFSMYRTTLFECEHGKVYPPSKNGILYRKGIRVYQHHDTSIFDYDFESIAITEDRAIKYWWKAHEVMYEIISSFDDRQLINAFLAKIGNGNYLEASPSSCSTISLKNAPPIWDEVIRGQYFCPREVGGFVKDSERAMTTFIPAKVFSAFEERFGKDILPPSLRGKGSYRYKLIDEGQTFRDKINKAVGICKMSGIDADKYTIHVAEFSNSDVLGEVDKNDGTIILSDRVMTMGQRQITMTIIEEYLHLSTGAPDESREFQDASLNLCISMMEKLNGIEL